MDANKIKPTKTITTKDLSDEKVKSKIKLSEELKKKLKIKD